MTWINALHAARISITSLHSGRRNASACTRQTLRLLHIQPTPTTRQQPCRVSWPCRTTNIVTKRCFSDNRRKLTREERRRLERRERNRSKREAARATSSNNHHQPSSSSRSTTTLGTAAAQATSRIKQTDPKALIPRMPLRKERMDDRAHWIALASRLPLVAALGVCLNDDDISPYVVRASLGPSMLPTVQFAGDIWLVETGAWRKAWRRLTTGGGRQGDHPDAPADYDVGDLVLWKDPKTERVSCKRIVGVQGDTVKRYGEFVDMYRSRSDLGIVWPSDAEARGLQTKEQFIKEIQHGRYRDHHSATHQMLTVSADHVWLEGDCPLFSVDSRHYGPVHTASIVGRLVFRLWPWERVELTHDTQYSYLSSCRVSKTRPVPCATMEPYLGKKFGFFRVPKSDHRQAEAGSS